MAVWSGGAGGGDVNEEVNGHASVPSPNHQPIKRTSSSRVCVTPTVSFWLEQLWAPVWTDGVSALLCVCLCVHHSLWWMNLPSLLSFHSSLTDQRDEGGNSPASVQHTSAYCLSLTRAHTHTRRQACAQRRQITHFSSPTNTSLQMTNL